MKEMSDLICGKTAVGGNYNSTRDTEEDMIQDLADFRKSQNALRLYPYIKNKTISHGKAAEILGITKYELISLYDKMGMPYLSMDIAEVEEEIYNWQMKKENIKCQSRNSII